MEEKQEGPEGKQTPGVTGATISPSTIGGCPVARAFDVQKTGNRAILCIATCGIRLSHFRIRWIVNIVMHVENIIAVRQRDITVAPTSPRYRAIVT